MMHSVHSDSTGSSDDDDDDQGILIPKAPQEPDTSAAEAKAAEDRDKAMRFQAEQDQRRGVNMLRIPPSSGVRT